jgi:hypothetical protein
MVAAPRHPRSPHLPLLACLLSGLLPLALFGQTPSVAPDTAPAPTLATDAERETFLKKARIVRTRSAPKGVTNTSRVTLNDGVVTHDASVQTIEEAKARFDTPYGTELNFKDSWRFNLAAYRIDRLLELGMIPTTAERPYQSKPASFTWWVDDVLMDEQERIRQKQRVPDADNWNQQMWIARLFDQLIANADRNLTNLLIDRHWTVWIIDHSRAFRTNPAPAVPANLSKVERRLLDRLRQLNQRSLEESVGDYLEPAQIKTLLQRRDRIVEHFEAGGADLIFDRAPRSAPSGRQGDGRGSR